MAPRIRHSLKFRFAVTWTLLLLILMLFSSAHPLIWFRNTHKFVAYGIGIRNTCIGAVRLHGPYAQHPHSTMEQYLPKYDRFFGPFSGPLPVTWSSWQCLEADLDAPSEYAGSELKGFFLAPWVLPLPACLAFI